MSEPESPDVPSVDVVIVSWNVRGDLLSCLDSVLASRGVELHVFVVDNASEDGSADAVAERFPQVTLVRNRTNLGYAQAANQGLQCGKAPWVLLLNPDTVVPPEALARLVSRLRGLPGHAMVVPRLVGEDGRPQHSVYPLPSLGLSLLLATGAKRLLSPERRSRLLLEGAWQSDEERDVPWAIGAAMLVRRSAIARVGGLDESFFVYAEDLEWCDRFRSAGYGMRFIPEVSVTHLGNRSGVQRFGPRRTEEYLRNTVRFLQRRHGRSWAAAWVVVNGAAVVPRAVFHSLAAGVRPSPRRTHLRAYWRDQARFYVDLPHWMITRRRARSGTLTSQRGRDLVVISNNYPPLSLGGYELLCQEHVAWLRRRGDRVTVLTSTHGLDPPRPRMEEGAQGERVVRALDFRWRDFELVHPHGLELWRSERRQRLALERVLRDARPDAALVWHMAAISKSLLATLHAHGVPMLLVIGEPWPAWDVDYDPWTRFWSRDAVRPHKRLVKPLLRKVVAGLVAPGDLRPALRGGFPVYASNHLRQEIEAARPEWRGRGAVAHMAIQVERFRRDPNQDSTLDQPLHLLYAGRVERRKGVHTAVAALGGLRRGGVDAMLLVAGWQDEQYVAELRALADKLCVGAAVDFRGPADREAMPAVYGAADILLFPTVWPEPFGMVPLEAMAAGCIVVATGTGGSGEYLRHEENALLFPVEDDAAAVRQILRLLGDPALQARLRDGGRRTAAENDFEVYARRLDELLTDLLQSAARPSYSKSRR